MIQRTELRKRSVRSVPIAIEVSFLSPWAFLWHTSWKCRISGCVQEWSNWAIRRQKAYQTCGWDKKSTYRIKGIAVPDRSMVVFDLTAALRVQEGHLVGWSVDDSHIIPYITFLRNNAPNAIFIAAGYERFSRVVSTWDTDSSYRIIGTALPENRMIVFDLNHALRVIERRMPEKA